MTLIPKEDYQKLIEKINIIFVENKKDRLCETDQDFFSVYRIGEHAYFFTYLINNSSLAHAIVDTRLVSAIAFSNTILNEIKSIDFSTLETLYGKKK